MSKKTKSTIVPFFKYATMLALFIVVGYSCSSDEPGKTEEPTVPASTTKAITSFTFSNTAIKATIDETAHTIAITYPSGVNVTNLIAIFATTGAKVTIGTVAQVSGTTPNDFSKTLIYTVTAQDGSKQDYTITPPNSAAVLGFTFEGSNSEIYWELPALKEGVNTFYNAPANLDFITGSPVLPPGAELTEAGDNEASNYNSTGFTFTITAADGKTKKTYTIKIPVYNKTTNPYGIYTPAQLWTPNLHLNDNFKLINDITMPAVDGTEYPIGEGYATMGFSPIGDFETFNGTIDGDNHVVKNLTIKRNSTDDVAFVSTLGAKGVVKNLGLVSVKIEGGGTVGALVANNVGGTISRCYASGTVSSTGIQANTQVGGLVGINNDANGIGGKLLNSYSTVNVSAAGPSASVVGGLIGYNYLCDVQNCYATGSVSGTYKYGGALIGKNACEIMNCYATGNIKIGGGLVGFNFNWSSAPNCFWDTQSTGQTASDDGGEAVGKKTVDMKTGTPYTSTWTSANWKFTAGQYPTLVGLGGQ